LPNDLNPNVGALEAARTAVATVSGKLQDAIIQRDALRQEVENTSPMLVAEGGVYAPGVAAAAQKSKADEAEETLRAMKLRYTDQHPEVIAQKRLIEFLRSRPDGQPTAKPGANGEEHAGGTTTPKRSVPNPVYDQLKIKLIEADTQVASLTRQRDEATKTQDRLEKISKEQPGLFANIRTWTATTPSSAATTRSYWAACNPRTSRRPPTPRRTRSSCRSSIRLKFPEFQPPRIGHFSSPACCWAAWRLASA